MEVIIISSPEKLKNELTSMVALFEAGLDTFHLRKPEYTETQTRNFIVDIPSEYRSRVVLHQYHHLCDEYHLKGIHYNKHWPLIIDASKKVKGTQSTSIHTLAELKSNKIPLDYIFLSPIFDSISKPGYQTNFKVAELKHTLLKVNQKVFALGGIDETNILETKEIGFKGVALLGAIWQNCDAVKNRVDKFKTIQERCQLTGQL